MPYPLDAVQVFDGLQYRDYSKENAVTSQTFRPLGWTPQLSNALYLGFHPDQNKQTCIGDAQFPERMVLYFFFPTSQRTALNESTTASGQKPPTLVWEFQSKLDRALNSNNDPQGGATDNQDGTSGDVAFDPDRWRPLAVIEDSTKSLTRQGRVVLRGPGVDCLATPSPRPTDDDRRFWIRCRMVGGTYAKEDIPEISFVSVNVVQVENRSTFQNEVVGIGDGIRSLFVLGNQPVDPKSVQLVLVNDSTGTESPCVLQENFYASKRGDLHFTLNPNSGEVQFGNGKQGRPPAVGETLVAKSYLAGGGANGNIPANTIKDPPLGVSGLDSVINPRAAEGGMNEESMDELLERAPRVLRGNTRAVTKDDYRQLSEDVPGVGRAIVLPQALPQYPGLKIPGAVTVVVIPKVPLRDTTGQSTPAQYIPSSELLEAVKDKLNDCRPAGMEIAVVGPRQHRLSLQVTVTQAAGITENQAKDQVRAALEHYFQPVEDPEVLPKIDPVTHQSRKLPSPRWEIGTLIYPSRLYEVLFSAKDSDTNQPLVQDIAELTLRDSGEKFELGRAVELNQDELPVVDVTVQITPVNDRRRT
ncbi:MAG: baseplate J/gp47 family protein [Planctomycetota bacterium]